MTQMEAKSEEVDVPNQHITPTVRVGSSVKMPAEDAPLGEPVSTRLVISIDILATKVTADVINFSVRLDDSVSPDSDLHSCTAIPSQAAPSPATPVSPCDLSQASAESPTETSVSSWPCPCAGGKNGDAAAWRKKPRDVFPRPPYRQNFAWEAPVKPLREPVSVTYKWAPGYYQRRRGVAVRKAKEQPGRED